MLASIRHDLRRLGLCNFLLRLLFLFKSGRLRLRRLRGLLVRGSRGMRNELLRVLIFVHRLLLLLLSGRFGLRRLGRLRARNLLGLLSRLPRLMLRPGSAGMSSLRISALLLGCFKLLLLSGIQRLNLDNFLLCLPLFPVSDHLSMCSLLYPPASRRLVLRSRILRHLFGLHRFDPSCFCIGDLLPCPPRLQLPRGF